MNGEINVKTSDDLADLDPQTERDYLMIMFPTQKRILKTLEEFKDDMVDFQKSTEGRLSRLEASFAVGGMITLSAIVGLALRVIFGG